MLVTIDKILKEQNKSIYWLSKNIDCDFQNLKKLVNNKTLSISFDTIQKLCTTLQCTPNDIFKIE
jgi:putative transcriptional regulator